MKSFAQIRLEVGHIEEGGLAAEGGEGGVDEVLGGVRIGGDDGSDLGELRAGPAEAEGGGGGGRDPGQMGRPLEETGEQGFARGADRGLIGGDDGRQIVGAHGADAGGGGIPGNDQPGDHPMQQILVLEIHPVI